MGEQVGEQAGRQAGGQAGQAAVTGKYACRLGLSSHSPASSYSFHDGSYPSSPPIMASRPTGPQPTTATTGPSSAAAAAAVPAPSPVPA